MTTVQAVLVQVGDQIVREEVLGAPQTKIDLGKGFIYSDDPMLPLEEFEGYFAIIENTPGAPTLFLQVPRATRCNMLPVQGWDCPYRIIVLR